MQENLLWKQYKLNKDPKSKEELILKYMPLVKIVAGRLSLYFGNNVEYEELVSYAVIGLLDAIEKYDYTKGVKFETYAYLRIKGAVIDNIRNLDWVPRSIRQKAKDIEKAYIELEKEGLEPTEQNVAKKLGMSIEEYSRIQDKITSGTIMSLENYLEQNYEMNIGGLYDFTNQPELILENNELKEFLIKEIENLTEREQMVLKLYYYEELSVKEISKILGVSESRVSQLHTKALLKLRAKLDKYKTEGDNNG